MYILLIIILLRNKYTTDEYQRFQYQHEPKPERFDDLPDLAINDDDDDLADLYKSKTDNVNVDDYDPFGEKAFDDYLDKREENFKQREELYYKPPKPQKRIVSSKQLLASVLPQENSNEPASTTPKVTSTKLKSSKETKFINSTTFKNKSKRF